MAAGSTTACVGFLASTLHVATFSLKVPVTGSLSMRQRPLPLASQKWPPSAESSQTPLNGNVTPATNGEPVAACAAGTPVTSTDATIATNAAAHARTADRRRLRCDAQRSDGGTQPPSHDLVRTMGPLSLFG